MTDNKRSAAYESIFGRPSAQHHRPPFQQPAAYYQQQQLYRGPPTTTVNGQHQQYQQYSQHSQQYPQQYYAQHQQQDLRRSYTSSVSSQQSQSVYSHPYSSSQSYTPSPSPLPPSHPAVYRPSLGPTAEYQVPHPPSIQSSHGIIAPLPEVPVDPGLEHLTRQGLTPAQAYQAQIYQNAPAQQQQQQQQNWPPYQLTPSPQQHALPQPQKTHYHPEPESTSASHSTEADEANDSSQEDSSLPYMSEHLETKLSGLHLATAFPSHSANSISSPDSSNMADAPSPATRRSSESIPTLPVTIRQRSGQDRSQSMSAISSQNRPAIIASIRNSHPTTLGGSSLGPSAANRRRTPVVYPALLSRVAEAFRVRVTLSERVKDGLTYQDAFDGREAVDKLAYIIKTSDRCLALLLGRALDAQKFFHDVTYDHRLRDSANEVYQFRKRLSSPFVSGEELGLVGGVKPSNGTPRQSMSRDSGTTQSSVLDGVNRLLEGSSTTATLKGEDSSIDEDPLPTGVFTLLTDCYSPTCSRDRLCYSIACPRRLEQQSRLNLKQEPGLKRTISRESLGDLVEPGTLWIHSVPQEVVDGVSETEKKRQEAINEVIYTERDFVRDMEYLRDSWIKPLQNSDTIIPPERRQGFILQVFWNINDIISVNTRLRDALNKRQKSYAIVEKIGDILLDAVPHFSPFVSYGSHQLYGKYEFEREKSSNPAFASFVEETERKPESRKLELNGYLTKPTTRLARYPLLLEVVLKYTPDDSPDKTTIPQVVKIVREFLAKVNEESGKTENRFNLLQLDQQLVFRPGEAVDLGLKNEEREMIYKGPLNKRGGQGDNGELQIFLFDHALLMVKQKTKHEQYKVYRRPIPLELLLILGHDDTEQKPNSARSKNALVKASSTNALSNLKGDNKNGYPITFIYLGRRGYQLTLWASTWVARKKWIENIQKQQEKMRETNTFFDTSVLNEGFFSGINKVNCAAPFSQGRRVAYGTADGVYFSDLRDPKRDPVKVIALTDVVQLDILDDYQLLIVLTEGAVITFPLDALDPRDPSAGLKRAKRIAAHTSFFKTGFCLNRTLVCVVKSSQLSSTIKVLEPIDYTARGKSKPTFRKILQGGNDTLRLFREFYIPVESNSIHILKSRLCVGCIKGFEIIDLETLDTQTLLDPEDTSLDFIQKREFVRPMAIYRIDHDFLLCYDEFAFYINRNGWRARPQFIIHWEGIPTSFALHYPFVLAFEPNFVEIRNVETGQLAQVIQGHNLRALFASTSQTLPVQPGLGYNNHPSYPMPQAQSYGGRDSIYSQYSSGSGSQPQQLLKGNNANRDEIIMVSDDSILTLHPFSATGPPR
ncbi:hypothetical protein Clacol_005180 [Clathrus columnatus]|uniref:CNH-domain-containing protein n=1 Tax=Clathrus columnatus TaxID=1419009 RepID=A0AAV5A8J3_9AGAM|nr:hypothetical protein Clacol_005180 [Clathrus columnatus]